MNHVHEFLRDVDKRWDAPAAEGRIELRLIGSTALFLQTSYARRTKDGDILETDVIRGPVAARLKELAGLDSDLYVRHRMYLDVVGASTPLLPSEPLWHARELGLEHFDIRVLDVADVVVSKLIRFHSDDRDDIRAMIEQGHLDHARALARLADVIEKYQFDARSDRLPAMVKRFQQAERDWFGVPETPIILPDHVDN